MENEQPIKRGFFAMIPSLVLSDKRLTATAKLIYGEIYSLADEHGQCFPGNKHFADMLGIQVQQVSLSISKLKACGYLNYVLSETNRRTITISMIGILENQMRSSGKPEQSNAFSIYTSPKGDGSVRKKATTCPLLNGSPLKEKYPGGHHECAEYIQSIEEDRGEQFINKPKQYACLHKILKAGFDFDRMNRAMAIIDKKYGKNQWDFTTVSAFLEKGAARG